MDTSKDLDRLRSIASRDKTASILFGVGLLLIVLNAAAVLLFKRLGVANFVTFEIVIQGLTGAFAVAGVVFGLMRVLRRQPRAARH